MKNHNLFHSDEIAFNIQKLLEAIRLLTSPNPAPNHLQLLVDLITSFTHCNTGAIYFLEGETLVLMATSPPLPP